MDLTARASQAGASLRRSPLSTALLGAIAGELAARVPPELVPGWFGAPLLHASKSARSALVAMLGAELTAMGLVLTLGIFLYQSVSSTYSPRLVAVLMRKSGLRRVVHLCAFAVGYGLGALHGAGMAEDASLLFALGAALLLLLACAAGLLHELGKMALSLRPERLVAVVSEECVEAVARADRSLEGWRVTNKGAPEGPHTPLLASRSGYLQQIDVGALATWAGSHGSSVWIDKVVGDYLLCGEPLGWVEGVATEAQLRRLSRHVRIEDSRDLRFDPLYGLRLLTDVVDRALSPGVNDPYTAVQGLQAMRAPLRRLALVPRGPVVFVRFGRILARLEAPSLSECLSLAVDGPLRYGAGDPDVLGALLELAAGFGGAGTHEARRVAEELIDTLLADARHHLEETRVSQLERLAARTRELLASPQGGSGHLEARWLLHRTHPI